MKINIPDNELWKYSRPDTSRRQRRQLPSCPLTIAACPSKIPLSAAIFAVPFSCHCRRALWIFGKILSDRRLSLNVTQIMSQNINQRSRSLQHFSNNPHAVRLCSIKAKKHDRQRALSEPCNGMKAYALCWWKYQCIIDVTAAPLHRRIRLTAHDRESSLVSPKSRIQHHRRWYYARCESRGQHGQHQYADHSSPVMLCLLVYEKLHNVKALFY